MENFFELDVTVNQLILKDCLLDILPKISFGVLFHATILTTTTRTGHFSYD
jgi:hypothetical protein